MELLVRLNRALLQSFESGIQGSEIKQFSLFGRRTPSVASLTHRLAVSRRQTLDPKATDINGLVGGLKELINNTVGPAIEVRAAETKPPLWTLVDPNQLENALINLCINARDAMPNGWRLRIETANCTIDESAAAEREMRPGDYVELSVSDTGTGMSEEFNERAFDPFYTTKPLGQGTGLGLSVIYGFAKGTDLGQAKRLPRRPRMRRPSRSRSVCLYL